MTAGLYMRIVHRYLGFFLAGTMAIYALEKSPTLATSSRNLCNKSKKIQECLNFTRNCLNYVFLDVRKFINFITLNYIYFHHGKI